jgi:hypothetical protein
VVKTNHFVGGNTTHLTVALPKCLSFKEKKKKKEEKKKHERWG